MLELEKQERLVHNYWHLFKDYKKANNLVGEDIVF